MSELNDELASSQDESTQVQQSPIVEPPAEQRRTPSPATITLSELTSLPALADLFPAESPSQELNPSAFLTRSCRKDLHPNPSYRCEGGDEDSWNDGSGSADDSEDSNYLEGASKKSAAKKAKKGSEKQPTAVKTTKPAGGRTSTRAKTQVTKVPEVKAIEPAAPKRKSPTQVETPSLKRVKESSDLESSIGERLQGLYAASRDIEALVREQGEALTQANTERAKLQAALNASKKNKRLSLSKKASGSDKEKLRLLYLQNEDLLAENQVVRDAFQEVFTELRADQHSYDKHTDTYIKELWADIRFHIYNGVAQLLTLRPDENEILDVGAHSGSIVQLAAKCTESPRSSRFLLEAYVWRRAMAQIKVKGLWGGDAGTDFLTFYKTMTRVCEADATKRQYFSNIKWKTARDLDNHFGVDGSIVEKYREDVAAGLTCFTSDEELSNLGGWLKATFSRMLEAQLIMLKSKALLWTHTFQVPADQTVVFNDDEMEWSYIAFPDDAEEVTHCISPVVWKIGTADGKDFENPSVLCKAVVMSKLPEWEGE